MKTKSKTYLLGGWAIGLVVMLMGMTLEMQAQSVSISETNAAPDPSAMLDVQSVNSGMLIPRMTAGQRMAVAAPADGLIVYQTANSGGMRRGFWYYDGANSEWIHLGRGEYVGIVDQTQPAGSGVISSSHFPNEASLGPGQSQMSWFEPTITTPPTVIVTPEFTVVGTPPAITEYCQPDVLACSDFGRMRFMRVLYPEASYVAPTNANPPIAANSGHPNCTGIWDVNYRYVEQDGLTFASAGNSNNNDWNSLVIDMCGATPTNIGFHMRGATSNPKSFSFWVDGNQDGDFSDPGELVDTRSLLPVTFGADWYFGTGNGLFYPPVDIAGTLPNINTGVTKLRIMVRDNQAPMTDPCYVGDGNTKTYDFDMEILCGPGGPAFYPNDLNWCNVDDVTTFSARVSCFDKEGTLTDMKFHYKIIRHD